MEAFPIDVLDSPCLEGALPFRFLTLQALVKYAGLAQQYIFYYARSTGDGK